MEDYRLEQTGQEVQRILNGAAMDADLQAEVERATEAEGRLQGNIDAEEQARQDADGLLQQGIDDEEQRAKDAEEANAGEIEGIKALIPSTASEVNKLADTNYVNSSIQTATAEYRGDYNVVTDLHLAIDATHAQIETLLPTVIAEADKNDYCYVMIPTSAQTPTEIAKIERYKMTSEGWKFEYDVNNSTFTAEEWAAIKSGITSGLVAKLNALPTNADLLLLLAGKQDVLTFDSVPVPESNNPVKSGGVYSAIDDEKTARLNSDTAIHTELDGLQAKVPATASSDNKLVDQNQMNSSVSTATATYRGDWNVVSDLHLAVDATRVQIAALLPTVISTADNNDYCYVEIPTSAETPTQIERVERYKFNGTAWAYEYTLNNSGFTAAQWAAINSMITSGLVAKLSALPTNADLLAMLAQKQDNLTFDSTPTENSTNPVTSGGVFAADKALSDAIEAILLLIPSAASSLNKLVDTSLMNSSISTATATFRGTYNLVSNLGLGIDATEGQIAAALLSAISTADNNDYAFVQIPTSAETPAQIARTDRYKFNGTAWAFEYTLNTSGFTAAQWAAINSTITSALVAKLDALPTAAELQEALGVLTSGITAINQKIPSTASQSNKLVDNASMESYIAQVINILDASFNITSTDGHITLHITQVDGVITSVQVQSTDIASAADLALKASQADLTALASRVSTAEGNITSLTGRMGTAETNISNLQQLYNDLQQSKPVPVTALPSTGQQQGVIYRLAGTTSYSDYMWNGSYWVLMATYNNAIDPRPKKASQNLVTSGGVFDNIGALDVSELNATENPHTLAQYTDLSAALASIPTDYQKGGMSIKFVQSSDNKYVQYFLTNEEWSVSEDDWEKMNLEEEISQLGQYINDEVIGTPSEIVRTTSGVGAVIFPVSAGQGERVRITLTAPGVISNSDYCALYENTASGRLLGLIYEGDSKDYTFSVDIAALVLYVRTPAFISAGPVTLTIYRYDSLGVRVGVLSQDLDDVTRISVAAGRGVALSLCRPGYILADGITISEVFQPGNFVHTVYLLAQSGVSFDKAYAFPSSSLRYAWFYDSDFQVIGYLTASAPGEYKVELDGTNIPEGAKYVRINTRSTITNMMVTLGLQADVEESEQIPPDTIKTAIVYGRVLSQNGHYFNFSNSLYPEGFAKTPDVRFRIDGGRECVPDSVGQQGQFVRTIHLHEDGGSVKDVTITIRNTDPAAVSGEAFVLCIGESTTAAREKDPYKGSYYGGWGWPSLLRQLSMMDEADAVGLRITTLGTRQGNLSGTFSYRGVEHVVRSCNEGHSGWSAFGMLNFPTVAKLSNSTTRFDPKTMWYVLGLFSKTPYTQGSYNTETEDYTGSAAQVSTIVTTPWGRYKMDPCEELWELMQQMSGTFYDGRSHPVFPDLQSPYTGSAAQIAMMQNWYDALSANPVNPFFSIDEARTGVSGTAFSLEKYLERFRTMDDAGHRLVGAAGQVVVGQDGHTYRIGTEVIETSDYDVCTPTHILLNIGINDSEGINTAENTIATIKTFVQQFTVPVAYFLTRIPGVSHPGAWSDVAIAAQYAPLAHNVGVIDGLVDWFAGQSGKYLLPVYQIQRPCSVTGNFVEDVTVYPFPRLNASLSNIHPGLDAYKSIAFQCLCWLYGIDNLNP